MERDIIMKNIFKCLIVALTFLLTGCSNDLLEEIPPHFIGSENLYTSFQGLESGINGLYSLARMEREGLEGGTALIADMAMNGTDNMVTNHQVSGINNTYGRWGASNNASLPFYSGVFGWLYFTINAANTIIDAVETKENIDWAGNEQANRNKILAEARAIRAWAYRHLTYGWGDVPLSLYPSTGSYIKTDWERTPVLEVRRQIISDLLFAEKHIPTEAFLRGRMTKGAVQHYLAEMYLLLNKPDSTLYWTNQVINNSSYKLITNRYGVKLATPGVPFMDMFLEGNSNREEGNTEALWVFQFEKNVIGGGTNGIMRRHHVSRYVNIRVGSVSPLQYSIERGGYGLGRMSLTKWAINNYEPQDERSSNFAIRKYFVLRDAIQNAPSPADRLPAGWKYGDTLRLNWNNDITTASNGRVDWPFSRKCEYVDPDNVSGSSGYKDEIYLRLAETYLLKAEAQLLLNDPGGAANTINVIRRRSKASDITAAQVNIDFILDERSRELVLEEHRRYTLLRTNKWMERTRKYNFRGGELIEEKDKLFPIPQSVIDVNLTKTMPQNPGY